MSAKPPALPDLRAFVPGCRVWLNFPDYEGGAVIYPGWMIELALGNTELSALIAGIINAN